MMYQSSRSQVLLLWMIIIVASWSGDVSAFLLGVVPSWGSQKKGHRGNGTSQQSTTTSHISSQMSAQEEGHKTAAIQATVPKALVDWHPPTGGSVLDAVDQRECLLSTHADDDAASERDKHTNQLLTHSLFISFLYALQIPIIRFFTVHAQPRQPTLPGNLFRRRSWL
eukprot:scaffold424_cov162-Amphora_coffeaeformis.AAC.9